MRNTACLMKRFNLSTVVVLAFGFATAVVLGCLLTAFAANPAYAATEKDNGLQAVPLEVDGQGETAIVQDSDGAVYQVTEIPEGAIIGDAASSMLPRGLSTQSDNDAELIRESGWVTVQADVRQSEARQLLAMVNSARSKKGVKPLTWDVNLEKTAMTRAAETALFFSHDRTNGTSCFTAWPKHSSAGENIARGQKSAADVNKSWTNSEGHYGNMVASYFTTFAAACLVAPNGTRYWVECFGGTTGTGMTTSAIDGTYNASIPFTDQTGKLTLSGSSAIAPGETVQISATVMHQKGSGSLPVNPSSLTWRTPNIDVVSLNAGKVTGKKEGSATILALVDNTVSFNAWHTVSVERIIRYRTHVQNVGWQDWKRNGEMSGTSGRSLRLEGINIEVPGIDGHIQYRTHIQNIGWENGWKQDGQMSGTSGRSLRLEGIQIRLTGNAAQQYDVYYRVHCQNIGWMGWAKNGASAGSEGFAYRLEGIEIRLVKKGGAAPGSTSNAFATKTGKVSGIPDSESKVLYRTHVQNDGWQPFMRDGEMAGTQGRSLRLEGINIKLGGAVSGGIEYRTHIQNIGWESGWKSNGTMSGTSGRSLRLEAIEIRLTGEAAQKYDVYYRVHAQNIGWMGWAKNGEQAGTAGYSYRLEGINVELVPKGSAAPGSTDGAFREASYSVDTAGFRLNLPTSWRGKVNVKTGPYDNSGKYYVTTVNSNDGAMLLYFFWGKKGVLSPDVTLGDYELVGSKSGSKYLVNMYHMGLWLDLNWTSSGCPAMRWSTAQCNTVANLLTNGQIKNRSEYLASGKRVRDLATAYLKSTVYQSMVVY